MEFVRVTYPTDRLVYIDGEKSGRTNNVLRIEAGTHVFDLGNLVNYEPASQEVEVEGTTVLAPMIVAFTKKGG
ncbi:MAG TPA: PEGA domain-containing protein [Bryobacteraceae bacterium]|nr:PEGA domain-containing protein [Bryobacteraceae bacterium]